MGPSSLEPKRAREEVTQSREEVTQSQAEEVAAYWRGIWQTGGAFHSTRLAEWKQEMRERTRPEQDDETPDREQAWTPALMKQKNWKAPGPDGIPG